MNNLPKNWYASKTVWASLLTTVYPLFLVLAKQFGWTIPDADSLAGVLSAAGTVAAALVAVWGRVTAKAPIATPATPKVVPAILLFVIATSIVTGCTTAQLKTTSADLTAAAPVAAQITANTATPAQLADLNKACAVFGVSAATIAPVFQGGAKTTAALIANPGQAYCDQLAATGKLPANTDSNTAPWLAGLTTALDTVKALAPFASLAVALL